MVSVLQTKDTKEAAGTQALGSSYKADSSKVEHHDCSNLIFTTTDDCQADKQQATFFSGSSLTKI